MEARIHFGVDLVSRVIGGEADAQFEFYALVNVYIVRMCMKFYHLDHHTIEDISQTICLSLHRNLAYIENLEAWLGAAIRRRVKDLDGFRYMTLDEAGTEASNQSPEQAIALWDALHRLSGLCKRIIFFHFIHGYSQRSIARTEQVSEGTIPLRKKECLGKLFTLYHGEADGG